MDHNDLTVGTDTKREELQLGRLNLSENASSAHTKHIIRYPDSTETIRMNTFEYFFILFSQIQISFKAPTE